MKNLFKVFISAILFLSFSTISFGQETAMNLSRSILLKGDSMEEEIKIKIDQPVNYLYLKIDCRVTSGKVKLELYAPNGEKKGNFTIEEQLNTSEENTKEESVQGKITKEIKNPMQGDWIVKIVPIKTKGKVSIQSDILYK